MTFSSAVDIPRQFQTQRSFDSFEKPEKKWYFDAWRERNYGTTLQGMASFGYNVLNDFFEMTPNWEIAQGFEPDTLRMFDPEAYRTEVTDFRREIPFVKRLDSSGEDTESGNRRVDFMRLPSDLPWSPDYLREMFQGYLTGGEALQVNMHALRMDGVFGRDAAAYAYRKRLLGQLGRAYGSTIDAGPLSFGAPEEEGESWAEHTASKIATILQDGGSLIGTALQNKNASSEIVAALTHDEKDKKYLSDIDGSFLAEQYFNDTYAKIPQLMNVIDRNHFDINYVKMLSNKEQVDYLVARALSFSTLADSLSAFHEESYLGEFGFTLMNLPNLLINDPDAQLILLSLPVTAGRSAALAGSLPAKTVGKAVAKQTAMQILRQQRSIGRALAQKGLKKQLEKGLLNTSKGRFYYAATRLGWKEAIASTSFGTRLGKIFTRAGKAGAFGRYVNRGFKVDPTSRLRILDVGAKTFGLGLVQGGISDYFSQVEAVREADLLGSASLFDQQIDYTRVGISALAAGVIAGGIGAGASSIGRLINPASRETAEQADLPLQRPTDEALETAGARTEDPEQVLVVEDEATPQESTVAMNAADEAANETGVQILNGDEPNPEGNVSAAVNREESREALRRLYVRYKAKRRGQEAGEAYSAIKKYIQMQKGVFEKNKAIKIRMEEAVEKATTQREKANEVIRDVMEAVKKAEEAVSAARVKVKQEVEKADNDFTLGEDGILRQGNRDVNSLEANVIQRYERQYSELFNAYTNLRDSIELQDRAIRDGYRAAFQAENTATRAEMEAGTWKPTEITIRDEKATQPVPVVVREQADANNIPQREVAEKAIETSKLENRVVGTTNKTTRNPNKRGNLKRRQDSTANLGRVPKEKLQEIANRARRQTPADRTPVLSEKAKNRARKLGQNIDELEADLNQKVTRIGEIETREPDWVPKNEAPVGDVVNYAGRNARENLKNVPTERLEYALNEIENGTGRASRDEAVIMITGVDAGIIQGGKKMAFRLKRLWAEPEELRAEIARRKQETAETFDIITEVRPTVKDGKFGDSEVIYNTFTLQDILDEITSREQIGPKANDSGTLVRLTNGDSGHGFSSGMPSEPIVVEGVDIPWKQPRATRRTIKLRKQRDLSKKQIRQAKLAIDSPEYFASISSGHAALNAYMELTGRLMPGLTPAVRAVIRGMLATEPNAAIYLRDSIFRRYDPKALEAREKLLKILEKHEGKQPDGETGIVKGFTEDELSELQNLLDTLYVSSDENHINLSSKAKRVDERYPLGHPEWDMEARWITYLDKDDIELMYQLTNTDERGGLTSGYVTNDKFPLRGDKTVRIVSLFNDEKRFIPDSPNEIMQKAHLFIHEMAGHLLEFENDVIATPLINAYYLSVMRSAPLRAAHEEILNFFGATTDRYGTINAHEMFAELTSILLNDQFSRADLFDYIARSDFDKAPDEIKGSFLSILNDIIDHISTVSNKISTIIKNRIEPIAEMLTMAKNTKDLFQRNKHYDEILTSFSELRNSVNEKIKSDSFEYRYLTPELAYQIRFSLQTQIRKNEDVSVLQERLDGVLRMIHSNDDKNELFYKALESLNLTKLLKGAKTIEEVITRLYELKSKQKGHKDIDVSTAIDTLIDLLSKRFEHTQNVRLKGIKPSKAQLDQAREKGMVTIAPDRIEDVLPIESVIRIVLDPLRTRTEIQALAVHGKDANPNAIKATADELLSDQIQSAFYAAEEQASIYWQKAYITFNNWEETNLFLGNDYFLDLVPLPLDLKMAIGESRWRYQENLRVLSDSQAMRQVLDIDNYWEILRHWWEMKHPHIKGGQRGKPNVFGTVRSGGRRPLILYAGDDNLTGLKEGKNGSVIFTSRTSTALYSSQGRGITGFYNNGIGVNLVVWPRVKTSRIEKQAMKFLLSQPMTKEHFIELNAMNIDTYFAYRIKQAELDRRWIRINEDQVNTSPLLQEKIKENNRKIEDYKQNKDKYSDAEVKKLHEEREVLEKTYEGTLKKQEELLDKRRVEAVDLITNHYYETIENYKLLIKLMEEASSDKAIKQEIASIKKEIERIEFYADRLNDYPIERITDNVIDEYDAWIRPKREYFNEAIDLFLVGIRAGLKDPPSSLGINRALQIILEAGRMGEGGVFVRTKEKGTTKFDDDIVGVLFDESSSVRSIEQIKEDAKKNIDKAKEAKSGMSLRARRQNAFMDDMVDHVSKSDKEPKEAIVENIPEAQDKALDAEIEGVSEKFDEDGIQTLDDGSIDFDPNKLVTSYFNMQEKMNRFIRGKFNDNQDIADESFSKVSLKIVNGSIKPNPKETTTKKKLINYFIKSTYNAAQAYKKSLKLGQMTEGAQTEAAFTPAKNISNEIEGTIESTNSDIISNMLRTLEREKIISKDEALAFREYNNWMERKRYLAALKRERGDLNKAQTKNKPRLEEVNSQITKVEKEPTTKTQVIEFLNSKTDKKFTLRNFTSTKTKVEGALQENFVYRDDNKIMDYIGAVEKQRNEQVIKPLDISQTRDTSPTVAPKVNLDEADPVIPLDSTTEKINSKATETAETGKPITVVVKDISDNDDVIIGTSSPEEASIVKDNQNSDVTSTVSASLKNPLVIEEPIDELNVISLIQAIPNKEYTPKEGGEYDGVVFDGQQMRDLVGYSIETLREKEPKTSYNDVLDLIQGIFDEFEVADGILVFHPLKAPDAWMQVITRPERVTELKKEVKATPEKIEDTSIEPAKDSKFKDENGNKEELDENDDWIIDDEGYADGATQPVKEIEPTIKPFEELSPEEKFASQFASSDDYLNSLGTDIMTIQNLLKHVEDTEHEVKLNTDDLFTEFISSFLFEANKIKKRNEEIFGADANDFFWKTVRKLRMRRDVKKREFEADEKPSLKLQLEATRMEDDIFKIAASRTQGRTKSADTITMGKADRKIPEDAVYETPLTPEVFAPNKAKRDLYKDREKIENKSRDAAEDTPPVKDSSDKLIRTFVEAKDTDNTRYIRAQGIIGALFGGADSSSSNWYREGMSNMAIYSQFGLGLKDTIYSHVPILQALTKLVDSTKAHTGHLINSNKTYIKTWMQSDADAKTFIGMITSENAKVNRINRKAYAKIMELVFTRRINKEDEISRETIEKVLKESGVKEDKLELKTDEMMVAVKDYEDILSFVYEQFFDLQEETGWKEFREIPKSKEFNPRTYVPIVVDPNRIEGNIPQFIQLATQARRKTIAENVLDIHRSIAYALGWLPTTAIKEKDLTNIFARKSGLSENRKLLHEPASETTLSPDTLNKLGFNDPGRRYKSDPTLNLDAFGKIHGTLGRDFWVLKDGEEFVVLKMIRDPEDLSPADRSKYIKAVQGETENYVPAIKKMIDDSDNSDIIMQEIAELVAYKLGQGVYGSKNIAKRNYQPILGMGDPDKVRVGTWVRNIQPEEIESFPALREYLQTNTTMSSLDFLRGRLFEMLAQRELDRMLGGTGVRMNEFLFKAQDIAEKNITKSDLDQKVKEDLLSSLRDGMDVIRQKYSHYSGTLTSVNDKYSGPLKHFYAVSKSLLQTGSSPMFGIAALAETLKSHSLYGDSSAGGGINPKAIVNNATLLIRSTLGDLRYDKAATREAIRDTMFAFDTLNRNGDLRFFSEHDSAIHLSTSLKNNLFGPKKSNLPDRIVDTPLLGPLQLGAAKVAYFANQVGSLQQVTDVSRQIAAVHWKDKMVGYIRSGKLESLIEEISKPEVRQKIEKLEAEAITDRSKQAELIRYVKKLARDGRFGGSYEDAMMMFKYGLTETDVAVALRTAFNELNIKNGRFDFRDLLHLYFEQKTGKVFTPELKPDVLLDAMGRLRYAVEQLVITRDISEPQGLSIQTGLQARTDFGRLFNQLFSWVQSFQNNLVNSYGDRGTLSFLVGSLTVFGIMNLFTMTLREWIRGRDIEDILTEAEEDPLRFLASAIASVPIMGRFNVFIEGLVNTLSQLLGSEGNKLYPAMGSPGLSAVTGASRDISKALDETVDLITGTSKTPNEKILAKYLRASQLDSFLNNSPVAVPSRTMEELDLISDRGQIKDYLDAIKRDGTSSSRRGKLPRSYRRPEIKMPNNLSLLDKRKRQEMAKESINRFMAAPVTTPADMIERTTQEYREKLGETPSATPEVKVTPSPSETPQSLSGPSRASKKVADILEDGTE